MKFLDWLVGKSWHGKAMIVFFLWLLFEANSTYIPACRESPRTNACDAAILDREFRKLRPFPFNIYPFVRFPLYR